MAEGKIEIPPPIGLLDTDSYSAKARASRLALWRPRSALRGCHQAKRCGASRSLGVVSSAAEPTTAVAVIALSGFWIDDPKLCLSLSRGREPEALAGVISEVPAALVSSRFAR